MKINDDYSALAKNIIELHDSPDFQKLSSLISKVVTNSKNRWFTNEKYEHACNMIKDEAGANITIKHVTTIKRTTSTFTLWEAEYSKREDTVLWQMVFDNEHKIIAISFDLGKYNDTTQESNTEEQAQWLPR